MRDKLHVFDPHMSTLNNLRAGRLTLADIEDRAYAIVTAIEHVEADLEAERRETDEMVEQLFGAPKTEPRTFTNGNRTARRTGRP